MVNKIAFSFVNSIICTLVLVTSNTHSINCTQKRYAFLNNFLNTYEYRKLYGSDSKDTDLELAINKSTLDKLKESEEGAISGLNSSIDIKDHPHYIKGRLNEWNPGWIPGKTTMGFFPIIIDDLTNQPNPLQLGFENYIRFRGKHVQSVFNSLLDKTNISNINGENVELDTPVFGMCFLNVENGQLAPLAVYGTLLDLKVLEGPRVETIMVKTRVLGRVVIDKILSEEPYIKAVISPIEDKPGITDPAECKRTIDEIMKFHDKCNETEAEMMIKLGQHDGADKISSRIKLSDQIDNVLPSFGIDPSNDDHLQAFAQLVSNIGFESHLIAAERYDALLLQNTEDRLMYVRNKLRAKAKQLEIINQSSKEEIDKLMETIKGLQIREGGNPGDDVGDDLEQQAGVAGSENLNEVDRQLLDVE